VGGRRFVVGIAAVACAVLGAGVVAVARHDDGATASAAGTSTSSRATGSTTTSTTVATTSTTLAPTTTSTAPPAPTVPGALAPVVDGEAPVAALDPVALADQILQAELVIRDPASTPEAFDAAARLQQVAFRRLGENPQWEPEVLARTPVELHESIWRQATARREFRAMHTRLGQNLPAWRIVEPLAAGELLALYQEAEARFGVPWYVLASVNLVETGMGRIVGLSSAGAQGPMQFMPATWAAYGMGGDVWNPRDAIMGAANYLAANGGGNGTPEGLANALFHYNRSHHYVQGVLHYAEVMRIEPREFLALHAWEIVYLTAHGDIVLPTGYEQLEPIPVLDWLAAQGR
jgi:membrane-bound lytic murein transglycosylase B